MCKAERGEVLRGNTFDKKDFKRRNICFSVLSVVVSNQFYLVRSFNEKKFLMCKDSKRVRNFLSLLLYFGVFASKFVEKPWCIFFMFVVIC